MSKRSGLKGRGTRSSIEHSDESSQKHKDDVEKNPLSSYHVRLSANEIRTYGKTPSHPNVEKGDLVHDFSVQGYLPDDGIVSSEKCKEGLYETQSQFAGLKVRCGSVEKHRPMLDRRNGKSRHMDETDCIQKETISFSPAVSAWWKDASKKERNEFLEKVFPQIFEWSHHRFEGGKCAGLQLHTDTAHLHVDVWMECGKITDFGGRIGKGVLYDAKVMNSKGVGPGICHLGRKYSAFKECGKTLSTAEYTKLEKGISQGKRQGRMHDFRMLAKFDQFVEETIGRDKLRPFVQAYVEGESRNNPFQILDDSMNLLKSNNKLQSDNKTLLAENERLANNNATLSKQVILLKQQNKELQAKQDQQVTEITNNNTTLEKQNSSISSNKTELESLKNAVSDEKLNAEAFENASKPRSRALLFLGHVANQEMSAEDLFEKCKKHLDDGLFLKYRGIPADFVEEIRAELPFVLGLKKRPKVNITAGNKGISR